MNTASTSSATTSAILNNNLNNNENAHLYYNTNNNLNCKIEAEGEEEELIEDEYLEEYEEEPETEDEPEDEEGGGGQANENGGLRIQLKDKDVDCEQGGDDNGDPLQLTSDQINGNDNGDGSFENEEYEEGEEYDDQIQKSEPQYDIEEVELDDDDDNAGNNVIEDELLEGQEDLAQGVSFQPEREIITLEDDEDSGEPFMSVKFTTKLKKLRTMAEEEKNAFKREPGSNSSNSNTNSSSTDGVSSQFVLDALHYLQRFTREQCFADAKRKEMLAKKVRELSEQRNEKDESQNNDGCQEKIPPTENSPEIVANSSEDGPNLLTVYSKTLGGNEKKSVGNEQGNFELPSYVQEMMEKDESLRRLLNTGCVTISQIQESPALCISSDGQLSINPVNFAIQPKPKSSVIPVLTDWSQFPNASKLLALAAKSAEEIRQAEMKTISPLSVGHHFSCLPGGPSNNGGSMAKRRKTNFLGNDLLKLSSDPIPGTSMAMKFSTAQYSNPQPSTSGFGRLNNFRSTIPVSFTNPSLALPKKYVQMPPTAQVNNPKLQQARRIAAQASNMRLGNGYVLNKLPLKRIIADALDKSIDDDELNSCRLPSTSKQIFSPEKSDEFDPMRFLEVTLQEEHEVDDDDDDYDQYDQYESSSSNSMILPTKSVKAKSILDDELRRKYRCPHCQKGFCWSTDLKRHILTHTGERPFSCPYCEASFTRKFLMQKHVDKFHFNDLLPQELRQQLGEKSPVSSTNSYTTDPKPRKPGISITQVREFTPGSNIVKKRFVIESNGKPPGSGNDNEQFGLQPATKSMKLQNGYSAPSSSPHVPVRNFINGHQFPSNNNGLILPKPNLSSQFNNGKSLLQQQQQSSSSAGNLNRNNVPRFILKMPTSAQQSHPHAATQYIDDYGDDEDDLNGGQDVDESYGIDESPTYYTNNQRTTPSARTQQQLFSSASSSSFDEDDHERRFPTKPNNPIVINVSSKRLNMPPANFKSPAAAIASIKTDPPRRINQSLIKQLVRANAQIKIAAAANSSSNNSLASQAVTTTMGKPSLQAQNRSLLISNNNFNNSTSSPSSMIPRLKR